MTKVEERLNLIDTCGVVDVTGADLDFLVKLARLAVLAAEKMDTTAREGDYVSHGYSTPEGATDCPCWKHAFLRDFSALEKGETT